MLPTKANINQSQDQAKPISPTDKSIDEPLDKIPARLAMEYVPTRFSTDPDGETDYGAKQLYGGCNEGSTERAVESWKKWLYGSCHNGGTYDRLLLFLV